MAPAAAAVAVEEIPDSLPLHARRLSRAPAPPAQADVEMLDEEGFDALAGEGMGL